MSEAEPVVVAEGCSKWYDEVMGVSDVSWKLEGGIVGLLGPNGAGKSTLIKLMAGLHAPSRGTIKVFGESPFDHTAVRARIGYAPEHEQAWDELNALELVAIMGRLSGVPKERAEAAAKDALARVGMTSAMTRQVRGYSKGMRQRTKLATAIVHDPDFLLLDEPLTGVDPMARIDIIAQINALAKAGKTVVVSSHVLYEIEALTEEILVINRGQKLASGNVYGIRQLIDRRPHTIRVECSDTHRLGAVISESDHVVRVAFERGAIVVETRNPDKCYDDLAVAVLDRGLKIEAMTSPDNNLGAVFEYLTQGAA